MNREQKDLIIKDFNKNAAISVETPEDREKRERIEAVEEMFTYWSDEKSDFVAGDDNDLLVKGLLFALHDAGYKRNTDESGS